MRSVAGKLGYGPKDAPWNPEPASFVFGSITVLSPVARSGLARKLLEATRNKCRPKAWR
jgi:hypothetical protein